MLAGFVVVRVPPKRFVAGISVIALLVLVVVKVMVKMAAVEMLRVNMILALMIGVRTIRVWMRRLCRRI